MAYILKFGKKFDREFAKIDKSISEQIVKKEKSYFDKFIRPRVTCE